MNTWLPSRRPSGGWTLRETTLPDVMPWIRDHRGQLMFTMLTVAVFSMVLFFWRNFWFTRPIDVRVDNLTWGRAVELQDWRTVVEDDWDVPPTGRELRSYRAVHHYDQVISHYETTYTSQSFSCGSSQYPQTCYRQVPSGMRPVYRDDPVYRTKYEYEIDKWVRKEWVRAGGDDVNRPYWPKPERYLREPNPPKLGDIRIGPGREEAYAVKLVDDDGVAFPKVVDLATWETLKVDDELVGHITRRGVMRGVDWKGKS